MIILNPSRPSLRREGEECKISSKVVEGLKAPPCFKEDSSEHLS
jgi:hypothetical protein